MIGRVAHRTMLPVRGLKMTSRLAQNSQKFLTPTELVEQKRAQEAEDQSFRQSLLQDSLEYTPKLIPENVIDPVSKRPVPLNVELLNYKPIRLPQTHGHEVAHLKFRGYDEKALIRASEFAARAAFYLGIPCSPVKKMKTEKRLYTVIRSPFAQAKSKENFHRVTFNKQLIAYDANPEVVDLWLSYVNKNAFEQVNYLVQVHTREGTDFAEQLEKLTSEDMKLPEAYADTTDAVAARVAELLKSDTFKQYLEPAEKTKL